MLAGLIADQAAEGIFRERGDPGRGQAQAGGADGDIELAAADVDPELAGLLDALEKRRGQADHGLAEGDDVKRHEGPPWEMTNDK
jgi:hypothetical protein